MPLTKKGINKNTNEPSMIGVRIAMYDNFSNNDDDIRNPFEILLPNINKISMENNIINPRSFNINNDTSNFDGYFIY